MARKLNTAETWETVYQAFEQINFTAYTFDSVKQSLMDYIRLNFPEYFTDWIESSELLTVIESFAYIAQQLAYRSDLNAHENFLSTAQRKESVLRLAKYINYNASRNIPARGLLKITSISTSEMVYDSSGTNLAGMTITWNDLVDPRWKERFLLVVNRALAREYGNVAPTDRIQINDVVYEQYLLNSTNFNAKKLPFKVTTGGRSFDFELVSAALGPDGPIERRPTPGVPFAVLFTDDGLGDSSDQTGFFCLAKQGTLQRREFRLDGVTPNYTIDVAVNGINNTDVYLNRLLDDNKFEPWKQVDNAAAYNIIFNREDDRNLFEVETLDNDQIRIVFGDGEFASVPGGLFELYFRTSEWQDDIVIPSSAIDSQAFTLNYTDATGALQTLKFTVSATSSMQNAASSESIDRIRKAAPAAYYAQDRMVTAQDYNTFPLRDNSILKLRSINRTFAGDSKYLYWHDPREHYENVKMFGNDLVVYYDTTETTTEAPPGTSIDGVIDNFLQPLLVSSGFENRFGLERTTQLPLRSQWTDEERSRLVPALRNIRNAIPGTIYGILSSEGVWSFVTTRPAEDTAGVQIWWFSVTTQADGSWEITHREKTLIVHSKEMKFWNANAMERITTYDTLNPNMDQIDILPANTTDSGVLGEVMTLPVMAAATIRTGIDRGLPDKHRLIVAPGIRATNTSMAPLFPTYTAENSDDMKYVYFKREDINSEWQVVPADLVTLRAFYAQFGLSYPAKTPLSGVTSITGVNKELRVGSVPNQLIKREVGRTGINFLWMHRTPRYHLVDPSTTNIIDMYVLQRGYYQLFDLWVQDRMPVKPEPATPVEMRTTYRELMQAKMISDTVIFHPVTIKPIIGSKSHPSLRAKIKAIKSPASTLTDSEIKVQIVYACREYFDLNYFEIGENFYFSELSAAIHNRLGEEIESVVLVPESSNSVFGDNYQVVAKNDEIIYGVVNPTDVVIVQSLDPVTLKQMTRAS